MAFLTKTELNTVSVQSIIDMITQDTDSIVTDIINESIDIMKSYLFNYYDVETIFNAIGTDRSLMILKYLKSIVIYEIYAKDPQNEMNEVVKLQYDEAILWLTKVSNGKLNIDLPKKDADGDGTPDGYTDLYSKTKYSNDY